MCADEPISDRVEIAFRRFDADGDGFLSWEEFKEESILTSADTF